MKHSEEVVTTTQTVAQSNDASRFPKEALSSTRSRITLADVDKLDSFELLYHLYKESGQEIIGCPQHAFAIFEKKRNALSIFTRQEKFFHVIPHNTDGVLGALNAAQSNGAIFIVKGEEVLCTIDDVTCRGATYGDAALRTLLKCQLKKNSEERTKYGDRPQDER